MKDKTKDDEKGAHAGPSFVPTHYIQKWRKLRAMTIKDVGEAADLSTSMISQLETGRSRYSQESLEKVAKALDVEPWELLVIDPMENNNVWRYFLPPTLLDEIAEEDQPKLIELIKNNIDTTLNWARENLTKKSRKKDQAV